MSQPDRRHVFPPPAATGPDHRAPWAAACRPALILVHAGAGIWGGPLDELVERLEEELGIPVAQARPCGPPSLADAEAALRFRGAASAVALEVIAHEGSRQSPWLPRALPAPDSILLAYRRLAARELLSRREAV